MAMCVIIAVALLVPLAVLVGLGLSSASGTDTPPAPDRPARVAGAAVARLPQDRAEWGRAMQAELAAIESEQGRRRFAVGIVRFVLATWLRQWLCSPLTAALLLLSVGGCLAAHLEFPRAQPFALVTAALLNVYTAMSMTFGARVRAERVGTRTRPGTLVMAAVLIGVAGAVALSVYAVTAHRGPTGNQELFGFFSTVMAGLVTGYVIVAVAPPFRPHPVALKWGATGGLICTLIWTGPAITGTAETENGLSLYSLPAALLVTAVIAMTAARRGGSVAAGAQAGLWTGLIGALAMYLTAVAAVLLIHPYQGVDIRHWHEYGGAYPDLATFVVDQNLVAPLLGLLFLPLSALGIASIASEVGRLRGPGQGRWLDFWIG